MAELTNSGKFYNASQFPPAKQVLFQNLWKVMDDIAAANGITLAEAQQLLLGYVQSVRGLSTDNTDPQNPVIYIAVDGTTITGTGVTGDPLVGHFAGGANLWAYRAKTTSTTGDPTSGHIIWDNATQISATQINASHLTQDGFDIDLFFPYIVTGDTIVVQDRNDSTNYQIWTVSGSVTIIPNSYVEIPVTLDSSGGTGTTNFANNHELLVARFGAGGATPDLATVLAAGNTTGGTDIVVSAGDDIIITDATASRLAQIGASKEVDSLNTTTYPSLTEISYVKGVTSAIQTQIDSKQATLVSATNIKTINSNSLLGAGDLIIKQYWIPVATLSGTVTSGATRYFGSVLRTAGATAGESKIYFQQTGTITIADIVFFAGATIGSNENISIYVRLNNTTDYLVATVGAATAERHFVNTSINVPIANAGTDYIEMKIVTPSWATPPTGVLMTGHLIFVGS